MAVLPKMIFLSVLDVCLGSVANCNFQDVSGRWVTIASATGAKEQTVHYSKGVSLHHSEASFDEWTSKFKAAGSIGFSLLDIANLNLEASGETSEDHMRTFHDDLSTSEKTGLEEKFPAGSIWQYTMFGKASCGAGSAKIAAFAVTKGSYAPPCCLPGYFLEQNASGLCGANRQDGRVYDSCRVHECPTCNGHGKPKSGYKPGGACECECDANWGGTTCGEVLPIGWYRIFVESDHRMWHANEGGDKIISTRFQEDSDYTKFMLGAPDGAGYRQITNKAQMHVLHANEGGDRLVTTRYQQDSPYTRFSFVYRGVHNKNCFTIKVKADGHLLHSNEGDDKYVSTRYQEDSVFTRFCFTHLSSEVDSITV